jgi:hypothetical protein
MQDGKQTADWKNNKTWSSRNMEEANIVQSSIGLQDSVIGKLTWGLLCVICLEGLNHLTVKSKFGLVNLKGTQP